jgi:hypothetical protein
MLPDGECVFPFWSPFASRADASGFGEAPKRYDWKGFLTDFVLCAGFGAGSLGGIGLGHREGGRKDSSSTWTKFEGNEPTMRGSRRRRPVHHDPSPALRHSMRSPSRNPRSRLVCCRVRTHFHIIFGGALLLLPRNIQRAPSRESLWVEMRERASSQVSFVSGWDSDG